MLSSIALGSCTSKSGVTVMPHITSTSIPLRDQEVEQYNMNCDEKDQKICYGAGFLQPVTSSSSRNKVALKPGRSLMDWIRLTNSSKDLAATGGKIISVTNKELQKHRTKNDAWICLKGKVYNITSYLEYHPGGEPELMRGAGKDATDLFNQVHKWVNAESMLRKCFVGPMKSSMWLEPSTTYHPWTLIKKVVVNHNVILLHLLAPSGITMNVPVGYHVCIKAIANNVEVIRSYTPVVPSIFTPATDPNIALGNNLYLMIKIYPEGLLTPMLNNFKIGESILISDCMGTFPLEKLNQCSLLIMLAAGTGFTPMIRIIHYACQLDDKKEMLLIFFNRTVKDIIWREDLNMLSGIHERFSVYHVLSESDEDWDGETGIISQKLLENLLPAKVDDVKTFICVCGSQKFTEAALRHLKQLDYDLKEIHTFTG